MNVLPQSKHYNLTHYQQRYNWDCGLSCILMILSTTQREQFLNNFEAICKEEGFGSSTWTIDLCYLLQRYQVRHEYYTQTLGIDPNYTQHMYYSKIIDKDEKRVTRKFKDAKAHGLRVMQRTVDMDVIIKHLARNGPVILLTNASLLTCDICKRNALEKFGYAGHYVVLCGYDMDSKKLYYHNPEVHDGHICRCLSEAMDTARTAFGTDQDIIFIYEQQQSSDQ
ncbi:protein GUCD1 isoform X2 [Drosophila nasuta]|uniref:Protein GUCD1 isoform X2 n=1 Tax=Drosophila albomicans TaxID=7291 RepID=A0A6P8WGW0_DROAB|nr:protein GUCD1 isoform X2 [Drosophila albomicans]XP_060661862.1 protein GUCD1 isoform X2 [Drosophila nasuta]